MKLLILDRDGVINHDSDAYIKSVAEWIPLPGSIAAIAQLSKAGWTVAIATNQSGIARGYYDLATLDAMHARHRLEDHRVGFVAGIQQIEQVQCGRGRFQQNELQQVATSSCARRRSSTVTCPSCAP